MKTYRCCAESVIIQRVINNYIKLNLFKTNIYFEWPEWRGKWDGDYGVGFWPGNVVVWAGYC